MQQLPQHTHILLEHSQKYIHTNNRLISVVIYYQYYYAQNIKLASVFDIKTHWLQYYFSCMYVYVHKVVPMQCIVSINVSVMILHNKYQQTF